ncbi:hypothetical protein AAMO2058_001452700 [Amorphochlora amoebiformis]
MNFIEVSSMLGSHRMIPFKSLRGGCTEDDIVEMAKGAAANINTIDRVEVKRHLVDEDKAEEFLEARKPRNKTYPWDYSKWDEVDVDDDTNDDKDPAAIDDSHTSDPSSNKMRGDLEIPMDADTRPYQGLWEYEDENLKEENETSPYVRVNVTGRVVRFEDGEETVLFRQLSRDTLWVNGYWLSKRETNSTHIVWHRSPYTNIWLRPGIQQTSRPSRILKQSKRVGKFSTNHSKESKSRIEK